MAYFKIRFINSPGFVSKGINWVTNSLIDHAEIEVETGFIGAHAGTGIQLRPFNYCIPIWERRYSIPCTDEQYVKALTYARSKIGIAYNYKDIFGLLLHNRRINDPSREICSQFVFEAAWAGGILMLNALPNFTNLITPEDLHLSPLLIGHCTYHFAKGVVN